MMKTIRVGTRKSLLALVQTQLVTDKIRELFPDINIELVTMSTKGDERLDKSLASFGGKGVFTKELEEGLLSGAIDIAIHSAKDMPMELPEGLMIGAVPGRADVHDLLVIRKDGGRAAADINDGATAGKDSGRAVADINDGDAAADKGGLPVSEEICLQNGADILAGLPKGFRIGTGSLRRELQLRDVNPELCVSPIRGNVQTRLNKLADGGYDGIILAKAGIVRLMQNRREDDSFDYGRFSYYELDTETMLPAAGQGILAVETRVCLPEIGETRPPQRGENTDAQCGENTGGQRGENTDAQCGENTDARCGENTDAQCGENTESQCGEHIGAQTGGIDDADLRKVLHAINDENAQIMLEAERAFLAAIGGSCNAPAAALSQVDGPSISMTAMFAPDGMTTKKVSQRGEASCAADLGADLARVLLECV